MDCCHPAGGRLCDCSTNSVSTQVTVTKFIEVVDCSTLVSAHSITTCSSTLPAAHMSRLHFSISKLNSQKWSLQRLISKGHNSWTQSLEVDS